MRPILLQWRGFQLRSYAVLLYVGIVVGIAAGIAAAHASGLDVLRVYVATLTLIAFGFLGARLFYVGAHWRRYRSDLLRILKSNQPGAVQYGGLITALLVSVPLLKALRLPFGAYWDSAAFTCLTAAIFGRAGCLMHGCCAGRSSASWMGVSLPNRSGVWSRRIPTQGLEAGWSLVLLLAAIVIRSRLPTGALSWAVLGGHAVGRLVLESTREEHARFGRPAVRQVTFVVFIVWSLTALAAVWHQ